MSVPIQAEANSADTDLTVNHWCHNSRPEGCCLLCRFADACAAYCDGGRPAQGLAILQQLADNAVTQRQFADAAHGHYKLSMEAMKVWVCA